MSYSDDFEQWKETIENVPTKDVKLPNLPVDDFVASIETLAVDANEDRDALAASGLDVTLIDELRPLSGALRYCQANWMSIFRAREEAQNQWKEQSPQAFEFRNELLHDFSFAYRNLDDVKKKVMRIREGGSNADMVQDLLDLAVLGEKYPEPLTAIHFDMGKLAQSRALSHSMSELLAASNGTAGEGNESKVLRDKAYTLLAEKARIIRDYGQYVFWKNEDKLKRYYS
jgi:plasmid stability protein